MRITFINVGYGDAVLLQGADGYTALVDGGSNLPQEFSGDMFRIRAIDFLKAQGITYIDDLIISHIHEDHTCGLEPVLGHIEVGQIYVPYPVEPFLNGYELEENIQSVPSVSLYSKALNAYRRILVYATQKRIPIKTLITGEQVIPSENITISVLAPKASSIDKYMELIEKTYTADNNALLVKYLKELDATSNNTSFLLKVEAQEAEVLLTSDNCPEEWDEVSTDLLQNVNVLKLSHHGQIDSISEQIMKEMPLTHIITTSASDRRYNSANPEVYKRLSALYPREKQPSFLFSDERSYPPYFSQPEGFQAISLVINSGKIYTEFIISKLPNYEKHIPFILSETLSEDKEVN